MAQCTKLSAICVVAAAATTARPFRRQTLPSHRNYGAINYKIIYYILLFDIYLCWAGASTDPCRSTHLHINNELSIIIYLRQTNDVLSQFMPSTQCAPSRGLLVSAECIG